MPTADLLLSQAVEGFLMSRRADGYSPQTLKQYRWALSRLVRFTDKPLAQISTDDLRQFMASVQADTRLTATSVFHVWKAICAFYKWTSAEGFTGRPDKQLSRPRFAYREIQPLTEQEIKNLLKAVDRTAPSKGKRQPFTMPRPTAQRDRAIVLLLLDTGIRASELCRLTLKDLDLQNGMITVRPYMSGVKSRPRQVPIGNITRKALWLYLTGQKENPADFLFVTSKGTPFDRVSLRHLLVRLGERAGVPNVHPHRFRHTFAIQYLRNGGDVFTLQRILGHSTLSMVQHYLAIAEADTQAAHRRASPVDNLR